MADMAKTEEFVGKVIGDVAGTMAIIGAAIGDRLGLFEDLAADGPGTSVELAGRTGLNERYVREWLSLMSAAGYVTHDAKSGRFTLPAEHVPVLAQEAGPMFFGGAFAEFLGALGPIEVLIDAFKNGGGVPQTAYSQEFYDGLDRFTASWHENHLVQEWLPAAGLTTKLEAGARVADVGCGRGRALIKMAQAYPNVTGVGYDIFEGSIDAARKAASEAGVADRIRFEVADVSDGLPESFDVITTFDVVHDAVDPAGMLAAIRKSLAEDGAYLCLDINCSDKLDENAGPLGTVFYGISILYCMTTSLAGGGAGLGTAGLHQPKLEELASAAGFGTVERIDLENPFNNIYRLTA